MDSTTIDIKPTTPTTLLPTKKWGYNEATSITSLFFVFGFIIERFGISFSYNQIAFPNNIIFGVSFVVASTVLYVFCNKHYIIKGLTSAYTTIVVLSMLGILVMIMGILPQTPEHDPSFISEYNLNNVTSSWSFIFIMLLFMLNLWFGTLKKIIPFQWKNLGFFLNHAGLFITVLGGFLGASDLQRLTMTLYEGETNWVANGNNGETLELPIAMTLHDFQIEQYQPKFGLANNTTGKLYPEQKPELFLIESKSTTATIAGWKIELLDYKADAMMVGETYQDYREEGSAPACKIQATNVKTQEIKSGWISSGSVMSLPSSVELNETYSVVMTAPEPKKFSSAVTIYEKGGEHLQAMLEVNKPINIAGWDIYQLSYDEQFGKWSRSSVVELVRDPWIVVVYFGIYMMLAGALYTLWKGRRLISTS